LFDIFFLKKNTNKKIQPEVFFSFLISLVGSWHFDMTAARRRDCGAVDVGEELRARRQFSLAAVAVLRVAKGIAESRGRAQRFRKVAHAHCSASNQILNAADFRVDGVNRDRY